MPTEAFLKLDGIIYTLCAFRSRQGWIGEWTDHASGRFGVIDAACNSAEEAMDLVREAALAAHGRGVYAAEVREDRTPC